MKEYGLLPLLVPFEHVSVNVFTPRQEIVIYGYLVKKYKGELHNIDGEEIIGLSRHTEYSRKQFMLDCFSNEFKRKNVRKCLLFISIIGNS